jgi:hypothetical protein
MAKTLARVKTTKTISNIGSLKEGIFGGRILGEARRRQRKIAVDEPRRRRRLRRPLTRRLRQ